ncbi:MAG: cytochrome b/b6 domain-containing protein [Vicinamibacterales bacterium]
MGIDFLTRGISPWGQSVFTHISWDLLWVSFFAAVVFLGAHAVYMLLSARTKRPAAEVDALEAKLPGLPAKIQRHSGPARMFHWVMAAAMFTLLFTSFLPIVGVKFAWVQWHWIAGVVLTASILFHVVHATFFMDFWSIWVGPKDIPELKSEIMRELGKEVSGPKAAKYPLGNRLYHLALVVTGLLATGTGLFMMKKVQTPFYTRDPYILSDIAWGWMYVGHGVAGVALVGLTMAHVYMAIRPENFWITRSMLFGSITRREYLQHHDPARWPVPGSAPVGGRPSE